MSNHIRINDSKCIGCLSCVQACPLAVFRELDTVSQNNSKAHPQVQTDRFCIRCMHCSAACPKDAILYDGISPRLIAPLPNSVCGSAAPSEPARVADDLETLILTRRSYRNFKDQSVPRELLTKALDLTRWAPSAENQHPVKWIVIESADIIQQMMAHITSYLEETGENPEILETLSHGKNLVMGRPGTLLLTYARERSSRPGTDSAIALTTAELYLQSQGIGTFWTGYLQRMCNCIPALRQQLAEMGLPEDCRVYGAMVCGWPDKERYPYIPQRIRPLDIIWK